MCVDYVFGLLRTKHANIHRTKRGRANAHLPLVLITYRVSISDRPHANEQLPHSLQLSILRLQLNRHQPNLIALRIRDVSSHSAHPRPPTSPQLTSTTTATPPPKHNELPLANTRNAYTDIALAVPTSYASCYSRHTAAIRISCEAGIVFQAVLISGDEECLTCNLEWWELGTLESLFREGVIAGTNDGTAFNVGGVVEGSEEGGKLECNVYLL